MALADLDKLIGYTGGAPNQGQAPIPKPKGGLLQSLFPALGSIIGGIAGIPLGPAGIIGGSALGGSLGEFGRQKASGQQDVNQWDVLKEGGLSGLFSGAGLGIGKLFSALKGAKTAREVAKGASVAAKTPQGVKASSIPQGAMKTTAGGAKRAILKPPAQGAFGAEQQQAILDTYARRGLGGSPRSIYEKLPNEIRTASAEAKQLIKNANVPPIDQVSFKARILQGAKTNPHFNQLDKQSVKLLNQEIDDLWLKSKGQLENINDFKLALGEDLTNAFKKARGVLSGDMTAKEAAKYSLWKELDGLITENVPDAKIITTDISRLIEGSEGLLESAEKGIRIPIPFAGKMRLPDVIGRPIQAGTEKVASAVERGVGLPRLGVKAGITASQTIPRALGGFSGTPQSPTEGIPQPSSLTPTGGAPSTIPQPRSLLSGEEAAQLILNNPEYASAIKAAYDLGEVERQKPLTAQQQKDKNNAESGLRNIYAIETILQEDPLAAYKAAIPGSPGARTFQAARKEAGDVLTRLRTGAALNEEEMRFYQSQLPQPFDSAETIQYKLKIFKDLFSQFINPVGTGGLFASDFSAPAQQYGY